MNNVLKKVAIATVLAGLLATGVATANAAATTYDLRGGVSEYTYDGSDSYTTWTTTISNLAAGTWYFTINWLAPSATYPAFAQWDLASTATGFSGLSGGTSDSYPMFGKFVLGSAGPATFTLTSGVAGAETPMVGSFSVASISSVPGPVAGAGLPLVLLGAGWLAARRRKSA